jgi:hypothetical protein
VDATAIVVSAADAVRLMLRRDETDDAITIATTESRTMRSCNLVLAIAKVWRAS